MRAILILVLSAALLVGCRSPRPSEPAAASPAPSAEKGAKPVMTPREAKSPSTEATPITEPMGKVASVNAGLRFVVIDFALNPVPQVDQRLGVYRQGQKVGVVKVSNQSRNSIVAADITDGEAQIGDEVRPE
jgi:hypothetical protein